MRQELQPETLQVIPDTNEILPDVDGTTACEGGAPSSAKQSTTHLDAPPLMGQPVDQKLKNLVRRFVNKLTRSDAVGRT